MPISTISSKRQITLPVGVLDHLGIKPKDKVSVYEWEGEIRIKKVPSLFDLAGTVKGRGYSIAEEKKIMMKGVADHALGRRK